LIYNARGFDEKVYFNTKVPST